MGKAGCQPIYNVNHHGFPNPLFQKTASSQTVGKFYDKICHKALAFDDTYAPGTFRSGCITSSDQKDAEFYIKAISSKEKRWDDAPYLRSTGTKQFCQNKKVSTNLAHSGARFPSTQRLDDKIRHFPGIFSCPDREVPPGVLKNQLSGSTIPGNLLTLWSGLGASPFFINHMLGRGDPACERMSSASLPRRLPFGPSGPIQVMSSGCGSREALGKTGLDNQLLEVSSNTDSRPRIFGYSLANRNKYNVFTGKESQQSDKYSGSTCKSDLHKTAAVTEPTGSVKLCKLRDPTRETTLPSFTNVSSSVRQETATASSACASTCASRDGLVARSHTPLCTTTQETSNTFSGNGRFGYRLGSSVRWNMGLRSMVSPTSEVAQQQKRIVRSDCSSKTNGTCLKKLAYTDPIRQSHTDCLYSQGRGYKISGTAYSDISTFIPDRQIQHNTLSFLSPGPIQYHSGQSITREATRRMAPVTTSYNSNLQTMGLSRNRPLCVATECCSAKLRIDRLQRSVSKLHRCLQQTLEVSTRVGVSTPQHHPESIDASKQCQGNIHGCSSGMASSVLAARPEVSVSRSPDTDSESVRLIDRPEHISGPSTSSCANPESVENWGWGTQIKEWSKEEKDLLKKSWRQSTISTYLPAIKRWLSWCSNLEINPKSPQPADLAKFLINLFLKEKLSYSTILVHKSAILTYCGPHIEQKSFSDFIIKHALKAISVAKPKVLKPLFTWDPTIVVNWLSCNQSKDSLFDIARRTATVLLMASGRRVHDLTLLKISSNHFFDNGENIFFIPAFGSKTDSHSHRQSAWMFSKHENKYICPVTLIRTYLNKVASRRSEIAELDNLFITVCGTIKTASRTVVGNWVRSVLRDSGIDASPGSCRSAVASLSWLEDQPIDNILSRGNWKSSNTFFNHYCKMINLPKSNHDSFFKTFTPT